MLALSTFVMGAVFAVYRPASPQAFDITVEREPHFTFGGGPHYCLGASLARLEARVVAETLLARTRSLEPTGPGDRVDGLILRGVTHLPVHARAS